MCGLDGAYQLDGSNPLHLSVLRLWSRHRINKSTACVITGWCGSDHRRGCFSPELPSMSSASEQNVMCWALKDNHGQN